MPFWRTKPMTAMPCGIGSQTWSRGGRPAEEALYKHRNRIERCFNRMKHCHRFAIRYDRRTTHFEGFVYLVAAMIWLR
ncbi:transposase [Shinella sp. M27]|uniref:transposase n=1 Tax=Shinella sp. M27 TaxID=3368614 RepID=UPI003BA2B189